MISAILKRRSVREYLNEKISEDKIKEILKVAMFAPSGNAAYPWELVVIENKDIIEKLSKITPWASHLAQAPVVIAIIGLPGESSSWIEDCSVVAGYMWLEAEEQGLASCWTHIRGNQTAEKQLKEILNIPDDRQPFCLLPIGVPTEVKSPHGEEEFDKKKIKYDHY